MPLHQTLHPPATTSVDDSPRAVCAARSLFGKVSSLGGASVSAVCGESGRDLLDEQKRVAVDQNVTDICFTFLTAGS